MSLCVRIYASARISIKSGHVVYTAAKHGIVEEMVDSNELVWHVFIIIELAQIFTFIIEEIVNFMRYGNWNEHSYDNLCDIALYWLAALIM